MRAVCTFHVILITIILIQDGGLAGHTENEITVRSSSKDDTPFAQVNIFLTESELEEWQNGIVVANISHEDTETMVDILHERFECHERLDIQQCQECISTLTDHVYETVGQGNVTELSEDEFKEASSILFYLFSLGRIDMTCDKTFWLDTVDEYVNAIMATDGSPLLLTEEELDSLLDTTNSNYHPILYSKCFDVESLFHDNVVDHDGATEEEVFEIASFVVSYLLQGFCIGTPTQINPEAFLQDIFQLYGNQDVIPEAEFEEMLAALSIGGDTSGHVHSHAKRSVLLSDAEVERSRRATEPGHDHSNVTELENITSTCFSGEELLDIHGVDHELGMTEQQFVDTCPSLVQQILRGSCTTPSTNAVEITPEVWIYGTIAVLVISLAAILGGLIIPFCPPSFYEKLILSLISLAVAVLAGDALIHLLPLALGLHAHEGDTVHSPLDPELSYAWKCLSCLLAIYLFYLTETLMGFWSEHEHSHPEEFHMGQIRQFENGESPKSFSKAALEHEHSHPEEFHTEQAKQVEIGESPKSLSQAALEHEHSHPEEFHMEQAKQVKNGESPKSSSQAALTNHMDSSSLNIFGKRQNFLTKFGALPVMVIVGDSLHNFGDGLAIGAAFAVGLGTGLSTSIAVFCHEVPHELGDLAILLKSGIKLKWALFMNFMSALTSFVGLYVGISVASTEAATQWIFAITAGMFLYVALADMMPQITHIKNVDDPMWTFFLQNVAFLIGTAFIFVFALYEDAISISL